MEKLTLQDCFKYPNARIKDGSIVWDNITDFIMEDSDLFHDYDWKLILRPLSSLTDEEKKTLKKLLDWDNEDMETLFKEGFVGSRNFLLTEATLICNYYYSLNIDFEIPSLQERGLCVYE